MQRKKCYSSEHTDAKKWSSLTADRGNFQYLDKGPKEPQHFFKPNLIQSKTLIRFSFLKAEGSEEAAEEKCEVNKAGEERRCLYNIKEEVKQQVLLQKLQQVTQTI